jgi:hypothetical protein
MDTTTTAEDARHAYAFPETTAVAGPEGAPLGGAALNPEPAADEVLREQFASVGLALRREGMVVAATMAVFTTIVLLTQAQEGAAEIPLDPKMGVAAAMMALLIPMAVWKGEGPDQRGYHHSMPVDQAGHAMMRTGAGLAWVLAGVAAFFAWIGLLTVVTGGDVEAAEPWQWAAPFAGATVLYLFGSALTLVTSHPWRWLGGSAVAFLFLNAFRAVDALRPLVEAIDSILTGRYGIFTLLTGLVQNHSVHAWMTPDLGAWVTSVGIWLVAAVGAFVLAAYRQPER